MNLTRTQQSLFPEVGKLVQGEARIALLEEAEAHTVEPIQFRERSIAGALERNRLLSGDSCLQTSLYAPVLVKIDRRFYFIFFFFFVSRQSSSFRRRRLTAVTRDVRDITV